ncbi:MAG: hypothetical protein CMP63_06570 [Flavobacteriales bacterium]|nr:hypothetical protein [Flavobacteriales bacterium]
MIKKHFISTIICFLSCISLAQYKSTKIKMAEGLLEEDKQFAALKIYEDIAASQGDNKEIYLKIAELHEDLFNYVEASKWYYNLYEIQKGIYPKSEFKFAELQMIMGKYKIASEHFTSFSKTYQGHDKVLYKKLCKTYIKSCKKALEAKPDPEIEIRKIPNFINSTYTDLAPCTFENKLYYSSIATDSTMTYTGDLDSAPNFQIYRAEQIKDEQFDTAELFIPEIINEPYYHTSNGIFSPDGKKFFFTRCKKNSKGNNICKIYCSEKKDTTWEKAILLGPEINDKNNNFSSTHPMIMRYLKRGQKRDTITKIIFASTMPGGHGGYDLWIASIDENLKTKKPENMGRKVNSMLNELTPYYSKKDKSLYFSSNGHGGFGGLDIFKTPIKNGKTKNIKLLDNPVNTSWDDWYYTEMNKETAFIVSNREGAKIYHNNTKLDDIFLVKKTTKKYLTLFAFEQQKTKKAIDGVIFRVKIVNDKNSEASQYNTNKPFQIIPDKTYEIIAQKNGYFNKSTLFSTFYDSKQDTLKYEFTLRKIDTINGITINNIYFDYDKYTLKPESKRALNKLYKLLIINPSLRIEIGAHTDTKGSDLYNMELSLKRAEAVVEYLVEKGIGRNVITAKGYGKSIPVSKDAKSDKNRRIVFKVKNENNIND